MEYYKAWKKNELLLQITMWINLTDMNLKKNEKVHTV